jgi:hypothetical protein
VPPLEKSTIKLTKKREPHKQITNTTAMAA